MRIKLEDGFYLYSTIKPGEVFIVKDAPTVYYMKTSDDNAVDLETGDVINGIQFHEDDLMVYENATFLPEGE